MDTLLDFLLSNALVAAVLALVVAAIGKVWRHPGLLHMLWVVVLLKLITPPFVTVPIYSATSNEAVTRVSALNSVDAAAVDTQTRPMAEQNPEAIQSNAHLMHTSTSEVAVPASAWKRSWQAWVIGGWLTGSVVFLVVLIRRVVAFQKMLATGAPASEAIVQQTRHLCRLLGLRTRPSILMLSGRISPVVWPFSRKAIVVLPSELFERNYSVRAPVSGQIVEVYARPGQWIAAGDRVCRIINMENLRLEGFVSPQDFDAEELSGREVTVEVMRARGRIVKIPGKIGFVSPLVEPASGVYRVWVDAENRRTDGHWLLRPGATATLHLSRD